MMISDEKPGLTNKCQLTSSEALRLMQPLHALIDQEKAPTRQTRFTLDLALQTSNWFCQSPLLKQLKSEVQSEPESTGL